jgi:hypothetical protein
MPNKRHLKYINDFEVADFVEVCIDLISDGSKKFPLVGPSCAIFAGCPDISCYKQPKWQ